MQKESIQHLKVVKNKTSITLEYHEDFEPKTEDSMYRFRCESDDEFKTFTDTIIAHALKLWPNFEPKEATSMASDYDEYYSREHDNNGYLKINAAGVAIEPPYGSTRELFRLNKSKAQSFVHDLTQHPMYDEQYV